MSILRRHAWLALALVWSPGVVCGAEIVRSPRDLVAAPDGTSVYVLEVTARRVAVLDPVTGKVERHLALPGEPGGFTISADGTTLYATHAAPDGVVWVIDSRTGKIGRTILVGHTPGAVVSSRDGKTLFVCNQFDHDLSVVDLATGTESARIPVRREPAAAALTPDGNTLLVANLLPAGPANGAHASAEVSIVDVPSRTCRGHVRLHNGSHSARGICVSPDGRFAYVTHILSRHQVPTTQLERGWMNTNAMGILDLVKGALYTTVLLDNVDRGAANPWAAACSADGKFLCVTHAGIHEISVIRRDGLHAKLEQLAQGGPPTSAARTLADVPNDLAFVVSVRRRIPLGPGRGPRGLAVRGETAFVSGYFSDTVSVVPLGDAPASALRTIALGPRPEPDPTRRGEELFHDASRCFQHWQSCVSCHPGSRADALNWDLLNDGIGNPKNTKSMLLAHQTPPAMISGIRDRAETAVRAGIRYIQFAVWPEEDAEAVDAYLSSLTPVASPFLENGAWSDAARRGQRVFAEVGCMECHPPPLYTDMRQHDLGTGTGQDQGRAWDSPTLVECWRTAPYLHDGRSATLDDLFFIDRHGLAPEVPEEDVADLVAFVQSL